MDNPTDLKIESRSNDELALGKRQVRYMYVISTIFVTYRRYSRIFYLEREDGWFRRFSIGLPYSVISLFLGWWGFPYGILYTPLAIIKNLIGGEDVTNKPEKQNSETQRLVNNRLQSQKV